MTPAFHGFRFIAGTTDVLIVAPHSPLKDGAFQNDLRTGIVAGEIQRQLGCCAVINDRFVKPTPQVSKSFDDFLLDLFRIDHSRKVPGYLDCIRQVVDSDGQTRVVWVHGIADKVAVFQGQLHMDRGVFAGPPEALHALIGYGQGGDPKKGDPSDRPTAALTTADTLCDHLSAGGMTTLLTHPQGNNFRGRDEKRLNQWFNHLGCGLERVESIQLEIKETGFRDSEENAVKAGGIVARGIKAVLEL
jgi:hypothetical protein